LPLLGEAIVLTLIGMGVVYASLALLMVLIQLLNRAFGARKEAPPEEERADIAPLLAAAAACYLEAEGPEVFVPAVTRGGSEWARRARAAAGAHGRAPLPPRRPG